jgi:hypothetical protein
LRSVWLGIGGSPLTDEMLEWPPDVFALAHVLLHNAQAFRFVLSPPAGGQWPPQRLASWSDAVVAAGREWAGWLDQPERNPPELLTEEWTAVRQRADTPLTHLSDGRDWRLCEALLTLHAIADEACAGLGVALDTSQTDGCVYRARGRELLARTGSLSRSASHFVRVLPKVRTPPAGRTSFARYASVQRSTIDTRWHKLPARHSGTDLRAEHANLLLLPWPLRIRESDFRPLDDSPQHPATEPVGYFEFAPSDGLDLDLLDRVLLAARDEAGSVDGVALPESAVDEHEIEDLEALLDRHGVMFLATGVRQSSPPSGPPPGNWVHIGVNPRLEKGGPTTHTPTARWFHVRQNKHHRWSLDEAQIYQYHLGGALHPHIRWWEWVDVPRPSLQFVEVGEFTLASLVCEDLAHNDDVADVIRSVGPTLVLSVLLDGPQLASRWGARYASVLADDPGSGVLTLAPFGMVRRSKPPGLDSSQVIALWKDPVRGIREIALEPGAHGVLLTMCGNLATRHSGDGRRPANNAIHYFDVAVHQIAAASQRSQSAASHTRTAAPRLLETDELTVLTGWAEAVAEALASAPQSALRVLANARAGAQWRAALGLPEPTPRLDQAISSITNTVQTVALRGRGPWFDAALLATRRDRPGEQEIAALARRVLRATLEQRHIRHGRHQPKSYFSDASSRRL